MDPTCDNIIPIVQADFGKLWDCKPRGNSIEIITPFVTATQKFASVFVTLRGKEYVVTDAGWIESEDNFYQIAGEPDETERDGVLKHYMDKFGVGVFVEPSGRQFYVKRASAPELLSAAVYDMANFIISFVNFASLPKFGAIEDSHRETFHRKARQFIEAQLPINDDFALKPNFRFDDMRGARFDMAVVYTDTFSLIAFVTGTIPSRFYSDFTKAIVNFELTHKTKYKDRIKKRVALINDESEGFGKTRKDELYRLLETHKGTPLRWTERSALEEYV